ncbi:cytoplasmic protein [Schizopora paradoxa]|uniref:Cytoplasmic protein n=1 Tax=Schizopora paradoxa TaxID=27342 RepID=A0A0H2RRI1_9AGAM|nr:cytoplasmic protein [Schizopora paradoxa]
MADSDAQAPNSREGSPSPPEILSLRALVSTKDAGIIIGKGGKNVADIREQTNVKAGVSKVIQGVNDRVLTVTGDAQNVANAYRLIIAQLIEANSASSPTTSSPTSSSVSLRLLISHNLMGTIIGRGGLKIKAIQDSTGVRMVASKDMLPQSTERIVEVQGGADAIGSAVEQIGKCLLEDWERGQGTVLFQPGVGDERTGRRNANGFSSGSFESRRSNGDVSTRQPRGTSPGESPQAPPANGAPPANLRTQNISIPSDMVGCIIGRKGSKITEIRRLSGSKISIAKTPHDETGERMFTIIGTPEANEKALFLLYNQLESEKERRVGREAQMETAQA